MKKQLKHFSGFFFACAAVLIASPLVGYAFHRTLRGALEAVFLTAVLGVLEASLSVDNAVVNATVLRGMAPAWRKRFLTWGILIAVFGMRIVFPLVLVSALGRIDPWTALVLAVEKPQDYAHIMLQSRVALAGFGATFLLLVSLHFFVGRLRVRVAEYLITAPVILITARFLGEPSRFLTASLIGALTFLAMTLLGRFAKLSGPKAQTGLALFVYLEVLDASFSLDGVVGAFAMTGNLFIIALGLGIGAMFVRSLTIWLVDRGALEELRYLEHGAFYAIGALALIMLVDLFIGVPEAVTGLIGASIIAGSVISSLRVRGREKNGGLA